MEIRNNTYKNELRYLSEKEIRKIRYYLIDLINNFDFESYDLKPKKENRTNTVYQIYKSEMHKTDIKTVENWIRGGSNLNVEVVYYKIYRLLCNFGILEFDEVEYNKGTVTEFEDFVIYEFNFICAVLLFELFEGL